MKVKHSTSRDLGVFDFKEEEEVAEEYCRWSKTSNPNSEDPAMKYQFLQYGINFVSIFDFRVYLGRR